LKRPSSDHDVCVEQSLLARDFNVEGQVRTGGCISKLLATYLLSFSSSLYSNYKRLLIRQQLQQLNDVIPVASGLLEFYLKYYTNSV
jgi:hypothetical protein